MPNEISKELIRQIDIISMVLDKSGHYSEDEIADFFSESLPTVRRDFAKIREMGIALHSTKRCLFIEQKIPTRLLNKLINTYLALNDTEAIKNLQGISKIFKDHTLRYFVQLVKSINQKTIIEFDYEKDSYETTVLRRVTPIGFFKTSRSFIFVGLEDEDTDKVRFYLIEKIRNIKFTDKKTKIKTQPTMYEFMKDTWGIYQAGEVVKVVLLFDKKCTHIKNRMFINNQEIEETGEGIYFRANLKISNEFISWILGWGKKCKVVEPVSLKNDIKRIATEILENYRTK
jgi:predicted DNA-binding transcriptional regulator YafY